jgi:diaminopimelate decarboxylase
MEKDRRKLLLDIADSHGTPCFVYFAPDITDRVATLRAHLGSHFSFGYAVKANPNLAVLETLRRVGVHLDVSSIGEFERGLKAGFAARNIGFTGPGKRRFELERAVRAGVGEMICESMEEIAELEAVAAAAGCKQRVLLRINPCEVPREFGLRMGGQPSQFGVDEEDMTEAFEQLSQSRHLSLAGFHAFSAGNSLSEEAIAANFKLLAELFIRAAAVAGIRPQRAVFGSGFGIPYFEGDKELNIPRLAAEILQAVDDLIKHPDFVDTTLGLEIGRWLVGTAGYMLTRVVRSKLSRGKEVRICDAGFNNNLSAAGMMGSVLRRDWHFFNLSAVPDTESEEYLLVGPLCASFDILANAVTLPVTASGHVLAVSSCGAYGLSASPTGFITHPVPKEFLADMIDGNWTINEISESRGVSPNEIAADSSA